LFDHIVIAALEHNQRIHNVVGKENCRALAIDSCRLRQRAQHCGVVVRFKLVRLFIQPEHV